MVKPTWDDLYAIRTRQTLVDRAEKVAWVVVYRTKKGREWFGWEYATRELAEKYAMEGRNPIAIEKVTTTTHVERMEWRWG